MIYDLWSFNLFSVLPEGDSYVINRLISSKFFPISIFIVPIPLFITVVVTASDIIFSRGNLRIRGISITSCWWRILSCNTLTSRCTYLRMCSFWTSCFRTSCACDFRAWFFRDCFCWSHFRASYWCFWHSCNLARSGSSCVFYRFSCGFITCWSLNVNSAFFDDGFNSCFINRCRLFFSQSVAESCKTQSQSKSCHCNSYPMFFNFVKFKMYFLFHGHSPFILNFLHTAK